MDNLIIIVLILVVGISIYYLIGASKSKNRGNRSDDYGTSYSDTGSSGFERNDLESDQDTCETDSSADFGGDCGGGDGGGGGGGGGD